VGGDLYDCYYASPGLFCFFVGDVSGKGAPAAMFMARTRSLVRMAGDLWGRLGSEALSPARIAEAVNRELYLNNDERMFVTSFLGLLDTRTGVLAYINAGHPFPYVVHASGDIEQIDGKPEVPLGVRPDTAYQCRTIKLRSGDAVFVVTDGVIEAMNTDGKFYTFERLNADLRAACKAAPEEMVRAVIRNVHAFTGSAPKADDFTVLALRWRLA